MASADTRGKTSPAKPLFAAMLRAGVLVSAVAFPIVVIVFWLARDARGAAGAALGALLALVFFAAGLMVMTRVINEHPISVLTGAIAVYLGQVIFLGLVIVIFSRQSWLDTTAFGLAVLAVALLWQVAQVVAFVRTPKPVYDLPENEAV
ncbi:hypothetical protein [Calidifontibacter terrae]